MHTFCSSWIRFRSGQASAEDGHVASQTIFCERRNDVTLRTFHGDSLCARGSLDRSPAFPSEVTPMTATAQSAHDKNGNGIFIGDEMLVRFKVTDVREGSVTLKRTSISSP